MIKYRPNMITIVVNQLIAPCSRINARFKSSIAQIRLRPNMMTIVKSKLIANYSLTSV